MRLMLISNSAQVVLVPILAIGLFWITATRAILERRTKAVGISLWGAYGSINSVWQELHKGVG